MRETLFTLASLQSPISLNKNRIDTKDHPSIASGRHETARFSTLVQSGSGLDEHICPHRSRPFGCSNQGQWPLKNKVARATGTLTGTRRATVRAFNRERARLVVFSRRTKSGALAANVCVNAVAPRPTDSRMLDRFTGTLEDKVALTFAVPRDRVDKLDDIARPILFLASGTASFVTNQTVTVDGGRPQAGEEKPS
jgi:hypothetical protein